MLPPGTHWPQPRTGGSAPPAERPESLCGPCYTCSQMGHYKHDCPMMECDLSWVAVLAQPQKPRHNLLLTIKVLLVKQTLTAFLDSGSSVSMIRSHLLLAGLPVLGWAHISCLHHHTQKMPIVRTRLQYAGRNYELNMVRVEDLPWPLLLGWDAPNFTALLTQAALEDGV